MSSFIRYSYIMTRNVPKEVKANIYIFLWKLDNIKPGNHLSASNQEVMFITSYQRKYNKPSE